MLYIQQQKPRQQTEGEQWTPTGPDAVADADGECHLSKLHWIEHRMPKIQLCSLITTRSAIQRLKNRAKESKSMDALNCNRHSANASAAPSLGIAHSNANTGPGTGTGHGTGTGTFGLADSSCCCSGCQLMVIANLYATAAALDSRTSISFSTVGCGNSNGNLNTTTTTTDAGDNGDNNCLYLFSSKSATRPQLPKFSPRQLEWPSNVV